MKHGKYKSRKTMKQATRRHSRPFIPTRYNTAPMGAPAAPRKPGLFDQVSAIARTAMAAFRTRRGRG